MVPAAPRLGQDLVDVGRFRRALARQERGFRRRVLTAAEWAWSASEADPVPRAAACFAAKEAAFKALGTGWGAGVGWQDVEVVEDGSALKLSGRAEALAAEAGLVLTVSLAHTPQAAVALVLAQPRS